MTASIKGVYLTTAEGTPISTYIPTPEPWTRDALCSKIADDPWHSDTAADRAEAAEACAGCPVRTQCADYWLGQPRDGEKPYGVWAGVDLTDCAIPLAESLMRAAADGEHVAAPKPRSIKVSKRALKPCPSKAAYDRHIAHGEVPCVPCQEANLAYSREYEANRRKKNGAA